MLQSILQLLIWSFTAITIIDLSITRRLVHWIRKNRQKRMFVLAFRTELWELLQWRSGTPIASPCRRYQVIHLDNYQPRIPRASFLCEFCYSAPQYGGRGECFEYCLATWTQCRQWVEELNILRSWKWSTSVCNSLYTCSFLAQLSRPHEGLYQRSSWWRHSPKFVENKRRKANHLVMIAKKKKKTIQPLSIKQKVLPLLNHCLCHRLNLSKRTLSSS